jgi:hypothetical protein
MKNLRLMVVLAATTAAAATSSFASDAHALGPIDLEIGAKAGVGTQPSGTNGGINPLGFGVGGRGGVSFFGLYAGVDLMYYLGGSENIGGVSFSEHTLMYGVDLGYNFKVAIVTIRPLLGIGNFTVTTSGGGLSNDSSNLYLEPGVTGLVSLGLLYVGADANLLVLPGVSQSGGSSTTETAFTLHGQVGLRF